MIETIYEIETKVTYAHDPNLMNIIIVKYHTMFWTEGTK
jgi:hypothetical protein